MSTVVVLDSGPLGLASNPSAREESTRCSFWVRSLIANRIVVTIPEIADYEVRRELIRARKDVGIRRLNELKEVFEFAPISSDVMLLAAELWAQTRRRGRPTADDRELDADVILAAQARTLARSGQTVIVATTNLRHLSHLADARLWSEIK